MTNNTRLEAVARAIAVAMNCEVPNDRQQAYFASLAKAAISAYEATDPAKEGWISVPREPTEAMKAAGLAVVLRYDDAVNAYRAMLAAAPKDGA